MSYVILQTDLYGKIYIVSYNHGNDIARLLMFYQIFLSPQVKRSLIIGNKVYASCLKSCRTTEDLGSLEIRKVQDNVKTSWNYNLMPSLELIWRV